jgi:hypothetical protein
MDGRAIIEEVFRQSHDVAEPELTDTSSMLIDRPEDVSAFGTNPETGDLASWQARSSW